MVIGHLCMTMPIGGYLHIAHGDTKGSILDWLYFLEGCSLGDREPNWTSIGEEGLH